mgnify:CR=1 FL=1
MTVEYQRRLEKHYDELKWLYCELYPNGQGRFEAVSYTHLTLPTNSRV